MQSNKIFVRTATGVAAGIVTKRSQQGTSAKPAASLNAPATNLIVPACIAAQRHTTSVTDAKTKVHRSNVPQARFQNLDDLVKCLGGDFAVKKVLIANNGLAAVKGINSIRQWCHDHIGDADAIQFQVMATPDDLSVNSEFIRLANHYVEVPGGSNLNNYANVDLIIATAVEQGCDAVYPGWGHASENPKLPNGLERVSAENSKCVFLGPSESAMFALGDKIASTIVAQSLGVPCAKWSGSKLRVPPGHLKVGEDTYRKAFVDTEEEAIAMCREVGLPVMLKASEGGGGKGIRIIHNEESIPMMFKAVKEEVKNCHVLVMKLLTNVRHLEVQLLADRYGNCIPVRTRDCSVQRRHQKVIEEGPVYNIEDEKIKHMEACAVRLAKAVGYSGLGTVEFMYDRDKGTYSFLELNPRIQVEHPVSELVSGVNLPAALLCVGMGIPLDRIPEVRALYGANPYGANKIDFDETPQLPPKCHCIAVRVTAEDTEAGFRPSQGRVDEITFRSSKSCWGYFSVASGGGVHNFADSQFGHVFSTGPTREEARRGMVWALKNMTVRGEIKVSYGYVLELLNMPEFRECEINTAWLDKLIADNATKPRQDEIHPALCAAAVYRALSKVNENVHKYNSFLTAGHTPAKELLDDSVQDVFVIDNQKYTIDCSRVAPSTFRLSLNGSEITIPCRELSPGALQLKISGTNVVAYCEVENDNIRVTINGRAITLQAESDPTKLRTSVSGKLVHYLVPDGGHVVEGQPYVEMEVMKMILPLKSGVSGVVHHRAAPGSTVAVGQLLGEVDPDDPSAVKRPVASLEPWPGHLSAVAVDGHSAAISRARNGIDGLWQLLNGYYADVQSVDGFLETCLSQLGALFLSAVTIADLHRPYLDAFSTPKDGVAHNSIANKMRIVVTAMLQQFMEIEGKFDGLSRTEAIEALKAEHTKEKKIDTKAIYAVDFAYVHREVRVEAVHKLMKWMENDRTLLVPCQEVLAELAAKAYTGAAGRAVLQARFLIHQINQPSYEEKKAKFLQKLSDEGDLTHAADSSVPIKLLAGLLYDTQQPVNVSSLLEVVIRRFFYGHRNVSGLDVQMVGTRSYWASWASTLLPGVRRVPGEEGMRVNLVKGFLLMSPNKATATAELPAMLQKASKAAGQVPFTVTVLIETESALTCHIPVCNELIAASCAEQHAGLIRLSCVLVPRSRDPRRFVFEKEADGKFKENGFKRNVSLSGDILELWRLRNYSLTSIPSASGNVQVYYAEPPKLTGKKISPLDRRVFARCAITAGDFGLKKWSEVSEVLCGRIMDLCVNSVSHDKQIAKTAFNVLFLTIFELTLDPKVIMALFKSLAFHAYAKKMQSLGFYEVEVRFNHRVEAGSMGAEGTKTMRCIMSNPTGHDLSIKLYEENVDFEGKTSLTSVEDGVVTPLGKYATLSVLQLKRLQAMSSGSTYVHDWPNLMKSALRSRWKAFVEAKEIDGLTKDSIPKKFLEAKQLHLPNPADSSTQALVEGSPAAVESAPGMLVWRIKIAPPAYFNSTATEPATREFICVANDITQQSGSFSYLEDNVFKAASELARAEKLAFV